jgi:hypothetical protein
MRKQARIGGAMIDGEGREDGDVIHACVGRKNDVDHVRGKSFNGS